MKLWSRGVSGKPKNKNKKKHAILPYTPNQIFITFGLRIAEGKYFSTTMYLIHFKCKYILC